MILITKLVVMVVAILHSYFLVLEMFLWDKPAGLKAFGHTQEHAQATKVLAANGYGIKVFFLLCVVIAGVFGGVSANRKILYVQALPGLVGLLLVLAFH